MKPVGDAGKNQKTVQGFTGSAKSAAKASLRPHLETEVNNGCSVQRNKLLNLYLHH